MVDSLLRGLSVDPFCLTPHKNSNKDIFSCTTDGRSFGYCNLVNTIWSSNSTSEHPMYTYFGSSSYLRDNGMVIPENFFGKVDLSDFCPFIQVSWDFIGILSNADVGGYMVYTRGYTTTINDLQWSSKFQSINECKQLQPGNLWMGLNLSTDCQKLDSFGQEIIGLWGPDSWSRVLQG